MAARTSARTIPTGPEEGQGLLFRNGAFAASVTYTLVTVETEKPQAHGSAHGRAIYTGVVRFDPTASTISEQLASPGQLFALETSDGRRLACRPIELLCSTGLRWIVQLS